MGDMKIEFSEYESKPSRNSLGNDDIRGKNPLHYRNDTAVWSLLIMLPGAY